MKSGKQALIKKAYCCNVCGTDCILIIYGEHAHPKTCHASFISATDADYKEI